MEDTHPATNAAEGIFGADLGIVQPQQQQPVTTPVTEPVVTQPVQTQPVQQPTQEPVKQPEQQPVAPSKEIIFEEETVAPTQTPAFNEEEYLTNTFGTSDKTVIKEYLSKFPQVQKDLEEAALQLQQPKYKNKVTEVLDEILSKVGGDLSGQKDFVKSTLDLLTTDENQLDPVSLVKYNLKANYPNLTSEQIDAHISQTYMQGDEFTQEQKNAGAVRLVQDAQNAKNTLAELKTKALTNDTEKVNALNKLQEDKRQAAWIEPVKKVVEDFKAIKLNLGKIDGKNAFINFEVPANVAQKYQDMVYGSMLNTGALPTDESLAVAKETLQALYIKDNLDYITQHVWSKATSEAVRKEIAEYHNPSVTGAGGHQMEVTKTVDPQLQLARALGFKG